jgi:hypothetical protein
MKINCGRCLFEDELTKDDKIVLTPKLFFSGRRQEFRLNV